MTIRFWAGVACGVLLGVTGSATAAVLTGSNGYLMGWTVNLEGEDVCDDPYIWTSIKEIECD